MDFELPFYDSLESVQEKNMQVNQLVKTQPG